VLRRVTLWSSEDRPKHATNYYVIRVGISTADGKFDEIGQYDGSTDVLEGNEARDLSGSVTVDRRLREGDTLLVEVERVESPDASTAGLTVEWHLALAGGNSQAERPLFNTAGYIPDQRVRAAVDGVVQTLNTGGVTEWTVPTPLSDPVESSALADALDMVFQGRIQRDSSTQISLQRYTGDTCVVNGDVVTITSDGLACTTSDNLIASTGLSSGSAPAASATLYYVYLLGPGAAYAPNTLKMSTTAPSMTANGYYLGTSGAALDCRFVGWVRTNATPNFVNDTTDRWVINYYNRLRLPIRLTPGYSDGNTETTYTTTSTTFVEANGGTGSRGSYIANGEDSVDLHLFAQMSATAGSGPFAGIGDNSTTAAVVDCTVSSTVPFTASCCYSSVPAAGYRTVNLLIRTTGGTSTFRADNVRGGAAADPYATALMATVMG
jgi:hypothetical protein